MLVGFARRDPSAGRRDRLNTARQPTAAHLPDLVAQASPDRPPYVVQFQAPTGPAEWFHARDPHAFVCGDLPRARPTKRKRGLQPRGDRPVRRALPGASGSMHAGAIEYYRGMGADWEARGRRSPSVIDVPRS